MATSVFSQSGKWTLEGWKYIRLFSELRFDLIEKAIAFRLGNTLQIAVN
jgi:hypothetical protein